MTNEERGGVGILAIVLLVLGAILWLLGVSFHMENTGTVSYGDCRQVITIADYSWRTYVNQFTCNYEKTKKGVVMDGECVHVINDSSLLTTSHTCSTAYIYQKKQEGGCTDPTHPYIGYDDMCYTTPQGGEEYVNR